MNKLSKMVNWTVLLILTLVYVVGFAALVLIGAIAAQEYPILGGAMIATGFACFGLGFVAMRKMELYC